MGGNRLAPGYRFTPTDLELVRYYLKRKILGDDILPSPIDELDIYKFEPRDLPQKSSLRTGDLQWHFFCPTSDKSCNGSGARNRVAVSGFWKHTGNPKDVTYKEEVVGKRNSFVYYRGMKRSSSTRTNWVMHEYKLEDRTLEQSVRQDDFVICKIFEKPGTGHMNGSEYGAPFKDEDWIDEEDKESRVAIPDPGPNGESLLVDGFNNQYEVSRVCLEDGNGLVTRLAKCASPRD
ncbi:PREDICTED: NAC domain-containing protein 82-like [Brassica oleracea var. oleracea]|uniref:NAC domain-containing protein 82-like n=1 Tax=Brassica oleracea var. oleracea TaxID=109376 RepID=UPI0006A723EE|nr:PREDICTED: NAC domain-containing protein 82-like [Brassica oleracea var. oleracea]XP_013628150.1 PREDICTED: NAC domain-containing protein 82-like [Brassica oleracea var. oleracea]